MKGLHDSEIFARSIDRVVLGNFAVPKEIDPFMASSLVA